MAVDINPVQISTPAVNAMHRISQSDVVLAPIPLDELMLLTEIISAGISAPKLP